MKTARGEFKAGWENAKNRGKAIMQWTPAVLYAVEQETIAKARRAVINPVIPPLVKAYWHGYLASCLRNE